MTGTLFHVISKGNRPVGCVLATKVDNVIKVAWSKCLVKPTVGERNAGVKPDKFVKEKAIAIAKNRAFHACGPYALTAETAEGVNQQTAPNIPGDIRKHLRNMAKRAQRYFK